MLDFFIKWTLYFIIRVMSWTYRYKTLNLEYFYEARKVHPSKAYILIFWHEYLLSGFFRFEGENFSVLASESKDGKIIGFLCEKFSYQTVYGSQIRDGKDKGGLKALVGLLGKLRKGIAVAVTVDGSVGPRRHVKAGVIELAKKSGVPIVAMGASYTKYWTLNTWDRFKIPKPFSTIILTFSPPVHVDSRISNEEIPLLQEKMGTLINQQEAIAQQQI